VVEEEAVVGIQVDLIPVALKVALVAQESSFSAGHKINIKRLHSCQ
jgi:hypothetical protein